MKIKNTVPPLRELSGEQQGRFGYQSARIEIVSIGSDMIRTSGEEVNDNIVNMWGEF